MVKQKIPTDKQSLQLLDGEPYGLVWLSAQARCRLAADACEYLGAPRLQKFLEDIFKEGRVIQSRGAAAAILVRNAAAQGIKASIDDRFAAPTAELCGVVLDARLIPARSGDYPSLPAWALGESQNMGVSELRAKGLRLLAWLNRKFYIPDRESIEAIGGLFALVDKDCNEVHLNQAGPHPAATP